MCCRVDALSLGDAWQCLGHLRPPPVVRLRASLVTTASLYDLGGKGCSLHIAELEKQIIGQNVLFGYMSCDNLLESCNYIYTMIKLYFCSLILIHIHFLVFCIVCRLLLPATFIKDKR